MSLKDIEAALELRFVERLVTQEVTTTIDKFPAVVGHRGTVKPLILNGQISSQHCEIQFNFLTQEYIVQDGTYGKPSTNHIYYSDGGELVLCDRAVLKTLKDRVYLMRTLDGKEGYLELFDPNKERSGNTQPTLDLDPQFVELKVVAIDAAEKADKAKGAAVEAKALADKNSAAISDLETLLDPRVRQGIVVLQTFGEHPRVFILGTLVVLFTGLTGLSLLFLHANMDNIYKDIRDRNQHTERSKGIDRTIAPGG